MRKINTLLLLLCCLWLTPAFAHAQYPIATLHSGAKHHSSCVLLGPKPSLMIRFKHILYDTKRPLRLMQSHLKSLSTTAGVTFTNARGMSAGYYILSFNHDAHSKYKLLSSRPGCFEKKSIQALIRRLKKRNDIQNVEPNVLLKPQSISPMFEDAPETDYQWNLFNTKVATTPAGAWANYTRGNHSTSVAVLDTGIENNEDLAPNIDITHAVSFTNAGSVSTGATPSCSTCSAAFHGTFVAGIVAATGNYGFNNGTKTVKIFGVAPEAQALPINVFTKLTTNNDCTPYATPCLGAYTSDLVNAINWLAGKFQSSSIGSAPTNVRVINLSLGGEGSCQTSEVTAINNAANKRISIVAAAGNNNSNASDFSPANCAGIISVAALASDNTRAYYSNYAADSDIDAITLAAPGGDASLGSMGEQIYSTKGNNQYGYGQGTSYSAPMVSGTLALMYAMHSSLTPNLATAILEETADPFPIDPTRGGAYDCNNTSTQCGAGSLNSYAAAKEATELANPPTGSVTIAPISTAHIGIRQMITPIQWCSPGYSFASEASVPTQEHPSFVWTQPISKMPNCQSNSNFNTRSTQSINNTITASFGTTTYTLHIPQGYECTLGTNELINCTATLKKYRNV